MCSYRYPQRTMDLVNNLSKNWSNDLQIKCHGKLQRTFLSSSDVASAIAKGNVHSYTFICISKL